MAITHLAQCCFSSLLWCLVTVIHLEEDFQPQVYSFQAAVQAYTLPHDAELVGVFMISCCLEEGSTIEGIKPTDTKVTKEELA